MSTKKVQTVGRLYFKDGQTYSAEDLRRGIKIYGSTLLKTRRHGVLSVTDFYVTQKDPAQKGNGIIIETGYGFIRSDNDTSYAIAMNDIQEYELDVPGKLSDRYDSIFFVLDDEENVYIEYKKGTSTQVPDDPTEKSLRIVDIIRKPDGTMYMDFKNKPIDRGNVGDPGTLGVRPLNMFFFKHIDIVGKNREVWKQKYELELMPTYTLPQKLGFIIYDSLLEAKITNRSKKGCDCRLTYRFGYHSLGKDSAGNNIRVKQTLMQWFKNGKNQFHIKGSDSVNRDITLDTFEYEGSKKYAIQYANIVPYGRKLFIECYVEPTHLWLQLKPFTQREKIMQLKLYEDLRDKNI